MASNEIFKGNQNQSNNNGFDLTYTTRAGLVPSNDELPYSITTTQVAEHLQRKLDAVVTGMRDKGVYRGNDIKLNVVTIEISKSFVPFMVVLPMSVLKDKQDNRRNDEPEIFRPKEADGTLPIYDPIMKMLSSYIYNKDDEKAFYSADWKRMRNVTNNDANTLKFIRVPRVQKFGKDVATVTLMIDPIRVFYDMLKIDGFNADFEVQIKRWKKYRDGEFRYDTLRCLKKNHKGGKKGNFDLAAEITRKIRVLNK